MREKMKTIRESGEWLDVGAIFFGSLSLVLFVVHIVVG